MGKVKAPNFVALFALLTLVLVASLANAGEGGNGSGGGKGFICPDNGTFNEKIYLADTYSLRQSGLLDRVPRVSFSLATQLIHKMLPQKIFAHPTDKTKKISIGMKLAFVKNTLRFEEHSFSNPPDFADDNIGAKQVPAGCKKIQVALQDLKNGYVRVSKDAHKLAGGDWLYLEPHETLIALRNRPGADTTEIRNQVAKLAKILSTPALYSKEILSKLASYEKQDAFGSLRLKTLYRMPRQLVCEPTWHAPREKYQFRDIKRPQKMVLTLTQGDGRVGEDSKYSVELQYQALGYTYRSVKASSEEARLHSETDNPAGDLREHGTFDFTGKFTLNKEVELTVGIDSYDPITSQFLGQYDVESTTGIHVAYLNTGNGLACTASESPILKHDERSSTYDK